MQKILGLLVGVFLVFAAAGSSQAILYTDVYDAGPSGSIGLHMSSKWDGVTSHSWTFDITDDGFNPITQDVTAATVKLHFSEYDWDCIWEETAQLDVGLNTFSWEVDTGWSTFTIDSLISLSDSGTVGATITATDGNFWFNEADLFAEGTVPVPVTDPVPEPATMVLFGLGVLGLAGVNRKRLKK